MSLTNGSVPITEPLAASSISINSATLNGNIIPNGLSTQAWFEYGTSASLAVYSRTTDQSMGSGMSSQPITGPITGLTEATPFYFRVCASNSQGRIKKFHIEFHYLLHYWCVSDRRHVGRHVRRGDFGHPERQCDTQRPFHQCLVRVGHGSHPHLFHRLDAPTDRCRDHQPIGDDRIDGTDHREPRITTASPPATVRERAGEAS